MELGIVTAELLAESATTDPPLGAAADRVTMQLTFVPVKQPRFVTVTGGVTVSAALAEDPLREAVIVTPVFAVTAPAVTANVPVAVPAATVTDDGVVNAGLLSLSATTTPPLGAALASVTEHAEVAPDATLAGAQLNAEMVGGAMTAMVPPVPETNTPLPFAVVATVAPTEMGTVDPTGTAPKMIDTTATTPELIVFGFMPEARQVSDPLAAEKQLTVIPAAVNAGPAIMAIADKPPGA